jgi:hypothetical protein
MAEFNPAKLLGVVDDCFGRVAIVTAFGENASSGTALDFGKGSFWKVAYWEWVGDTGEVDRIVKDPAFMAVERAMGNNGRFLVAIGRDSAERRTLGSRWFFFDAKGFVGGVSAESFKIIGRGAVSSCDVDSGSDLSTQGCRS